MSGQRVGQIRVALDQPEVLGAVVAGQLLRPREEQRRDGAEREQPVAGEHDRAVGPRREAARREAHEEVQEHAAPQAAGDEPEREGERRVRERDRRDAPGEAEGDHEQADAAAGPPVRGVEAGPDEAPHHDRPEDRPGEVRVLPVAREQDHDHAGAAEGGARGGLTRWRAAVMARPCHSGRRPASARAPLAVHRPRSSSATAPSTKVAPTIAPAQSGSSSTVAPIAAPTSGVT